MKSLLTAGLALASCAAFAGISQNFNGSGVGATLPTGFSGDGAIEQKETGNNMLSVDGTVTCANEGTASEWSKSSFMVKAPDEASDELTGDDLSNCQIAIATGAEATDETSKLKVMVYQGATPAWTETSATVTKGAWFTVGLEFDYTAKKAKVSIDGTAAGEYTLVTAPASTKISSLVFAGTAKVDDVSVQEAVAKDDLSADLKGLKIYLNDMNITSADLTSDTKYAGLTVAEQIQAGLTPKSTTTTFVAENVSTVTEDSVVKTLITVPCASDNGQVYKVVITDVAGASVGTVDAEAGAIVDGQRTLKFTMPTTDKKVLKINVQASAPSAS